MTSVFVRNWIADFGGRRFLIVLGCGIVDAFLLWHDKLTSSDYVTLTVATIGAYIAGNTYQKVKGNDGA